MSSPMSAVSESSGAQGSFSEGPIRLGSDAHKTLFCRTLLDTFNPYKPAVIDWPKLDTEARDRRRSACPFGISLCSRRGERLNVVSMRRSSRSLLKKPSSSTPLKRGGTNMR